MLRARLGFRERRVPARGALEGSRPFLDKGRYVVLVEVRERAFHDVVDVRPHEVVPHNPARQGKLVTPVAVQRRKLFNTLHHVQSLPLLAHFVETVHQHHSAFPSFKARVTNVPTAAFSHRSA